MKPPVRRRHKSAERDQLGLLLAHLPGIPRPIKEYQFIPSRRFRFDWAWIKPRIAVEYEGLFGPRSRHVTAMGYSADCLKYSLAAIHGWLVIRVTAPMVRNGQAVELVELAHQVRPSTIAANSPD
jgi:hypothetical protein